MCLLSLFQDKLFEYFFSRLSVIATYMTVFKASKYQQCIIDYEYIILVIMKDKRVRKIHGIKLCYSWVQTIFLKYTCLTRKGRNVWQSAFTYSESRACASTLLIPWSLKLETSPSISPSNLTDHLRNKTNVAEHRYEQKSQSYDGYH